MKFISYDSDYFLFIWPKIKIVSEKLYSKFYRKMNNL